VVFAFYIILPELPGGTEEKCIRQRHQ